MDEVEVDLLLAEAVLALSDQWGISADAAVKAMSIAAPALELTLAELATLVVASPPAHRAHRSSVPC